MFTANKENSGKKCLRNYIYYWCSKTSETVEKTFPSYYPSRSLTHLPGMVKLFSRELFGQLDFFSTEDLLSFHFCICISARTSAWTMRFLLHYLLIRLKCRLNQLKYFQFLWNELLNSLQIGLNYHNEKISTLTHSCVLTKFNIDSFHKSCNYTGLGTNKWCV